MRLLLFLLILAGSWLAAGCASGPRPSCSPLRPCAEPAGLPHPPLITRGLLFGVPERHGLTLSPDGRTLAFLQRRDGETTLDTLALAQGTQRRLAGSRDVRISSFLWARDSRHLVYLEDKAGRRFPEIRIVAIGSGEDRLLTRVGFG
jgi:hypothetical protein